MLRFKIKSLGGIALLSALFLSCTQSVPATDREEIKASSIIKMLNKEKEVNLTNKIIVGDLDFSKVEFNAVVHSSLVQSVIKSPVSFLNCQFTGKVYCTSNVEGITYQSVFLQNLIFNICEFDNVVDFQSSTVFGNVSFAGSQFKEQALFNSFYSHAKASYFGQIVVDKDFSMQDALFLGSCDFFKAHFKSNANFQGSRFDGAFIFNSVQCDLRSDFSKVRFNNNCAFNYTVFTGIARFNQLSVLGLADFLQTKFANDAFFTNCLFYDVCKFNEAKIASAFDFTSTSFYRSAPILDNIEMADQKQFKAGRVSTSVDFVLPLMNEK
jgi:uncharacterized protein YjbI with pentapeptide repeats